MTRFFAFLLIAALLPATPSHAAKTAAEKQKAAQEKRAKIDAETAGDLEKILAESERAKALFETSFAHAIFDNRTMSIGLTGGGSGKGVAVERASGKRTYMKMHSVNVGLGVGGQTFDVLFLFENQKAFRLFVDEGWSAETKASAVAGNEGDAAGASFVKGMAIFVRTDKGLMARADVGGTKYWPWKELNQAK